MIITKTKITGVYIIDLEPRFDKRGYFARVFCRQELKKAGIDFEIKQINRSLSLQKGMIRGLHLQIDPMGEDKIVHCPKGKIFDVALDLRKDSPTLGKWVGEILTAENKKMLLVPKGCAHGFQTLENNSVVEYFVSQYYAPENERGIRWDDPKFKIQWPIKKAILSEKDSKWPLFLS